MADQDRTVSALIQFVTGAGVGGLKFDADDLRFAGVDTLLLAVRGGMTKLAFP